MLKHSREEWNDILQKLMNMMEDDYPNNYELVVNSFSAEIRSNLTDMCFTRENILKPSEPVAFDISKLKEEWNDIMNIENPHVKVGNLGDPNNKTFDVVEAFHRMLLGRKVRRVDWEPEEWIKLEPKYYVIKNQRDSTMTLAILVCLESREKMWEEYEE